MCVFIYHGLSISVALLNSLPVVILINEGAINCYSKPHDG